MDNKTNYVSENNAARAAGFLPTYRVLQLFLFLAVVVGLGLNRVGGLHVVGLFFLRSAQRFSISCKFRVSLHLIHGGIHATTALALMSRPRRLESNILQVF